MAQPILKMVLEKHAREHGMTMSDVANQLNMSKSSLSTKLSGKRSISLVDAHDIAEMLGITLDVLWQLLYL